MLEEIFKKLLKSPSEILLRSASKQSKNNPDTSALSTIRRRKSLFANFRSVFDISESNKKPAFESFQHRSAAKKCAQMFSRICTKTCKLSDEYGPFIAILFDLFLTSF